MKKFKSAQAIILGLLILSISVSTAFADHVTFPSTNDENRDKGWAYVNVVDDSNPGELTLEFVSTRGFVSCFEYRTDGDTSQATGDSNFNPDAHDLYPYKCVNNSTQQITIEAADYVDVRMVFGAESDERFNWTSFGVLPLPFVPTGEITNPASNGVTVSGNYNFTATYNDGDNVQDDNVQWAIRQGTCSGNTVVGNVDGRNDTFAWDGAAFSTQVNTANLTPGNYCFVFNPTDDAGQADVRVTRTFVVNQPTPGIEIPAQCDQSLTYNVINGTNASQTINGTSGNDLIFARGGSDKIDGKSGNDCIVGGDGSDSIKGGSGKDVILGGDGSDKIEGGSGVDSLYGEEGSDSLSGGAENDMLSGGDGTDSLDGGSGNDSLHGGNGTDSLKGGAGNDSLTGDSGMDSAKGGAGSDTCSAESENSCEL